MMKKKDTSGREEWAKTAKKQNRKLMNGLKASEQKEYVIVKETPVRYDDLSFALKCGAVGGMIYYFVAIICLLSMLFTIATIMWGI